MQNFDITSKYNSHNLGFVRIPLGFKEELEEIFLKVNINRERALSYALLGVVGFLFCLNIFEQGLWKGQIKIFGTFGKAHIIMALVAIVFLFLSDPAKEFTKTRAFCLRIYHILICSMVLICCSLIGIENFIIGKQPFCYMIALFCITFLVYLSILERIIAFGMSYGFYIMGICLVPGNFAHTFEAVIFSIMLLALAFTVSTINYSTYIANYINNSVINNKNQEIQKMYSVVEENLIKRTAELNSTVEYEKLRTAFFANISHELRTPLNVIFSAQQMIEFSINRADKKGEPREVNNYTSIIKQNCYRLIRLIANLIDITKLDSGYLNIELKNMDIIKIVEDITMSVAKYIEDRKINLIFDTELEEQIIACDPDKIERIILNLLSNAIKFTESNGEINVNIYDGEDSIVISVKDTGVGIPVEMQRSIFDRFVQVDRTTSRNREGSGIGLSIVKSLVDLHNGNISLISETGKGSEFIIELPKYTVKEEDKNCSMFISENQNVEKICIEFSDIYK